MNLRRKLSSVMMKSYSLWLFCSTTLLFFIFFFFSCCSSSEPLLPTIPDEDWGYVQVRENANLFWWLYGRSDQNLRDSSPLVIWLQGGPGGSSTGFGNFEEIGPLDVNLNPRPINWVQSANVMFIDSPVGTGYSYVTSDDAYCTTDEQVGVDLVVLLQSFLQKYPLFTVNPLWIFCESYGGKEATSFGVALVQALQDGTIKANFKGVALGDSWISPVDFVLSYADYLLSVSEIDNQGYQLVNQTAHDVQVSVDEGLWSKATLLWSVNQNAIEKATAGINFYNILDRSSEDQDLSRSNPQDADNDNDDDEDDEDVQIQQHPHLKVYLSDPLTDLMNGKIREKLKIIPQNVTWGGQSGNVFAKMEEVFMRPYILQVDLLLRDGYQVAVYSGNLDLICSTPGTVSWMNKLQWPSYAQFLNSPRYPFNANSIVAGFSKTYKNLSFFNILNAGHMVPADQSSASKTMLETIISQ